MLDRPVTHDDAVELENLAVKTQHGELAPEYSFVHDISRIAQINLERGPDELPVTVLEALDGCDVPPSREVANQLQERMHFQVPRGTMVSAIQAYVDKHEFSRKGQRGKHADLEDKVKMPSATAQAYGGELPKGNRTIKMQQEALKRVKEQTS